MRALFASRSRRASFYRRQLTLCAVPSRWLSAAGCAVPQERLRSCATRTGGSSCFTSGHSCLRRCQKQPRPRRLRLLAVLGYIFFLGVCDASRRRRGLPRRLYGRGAALCEASEFLAPKRARGAWCGFNPVGKLPPARFRAHPRGPEAFLRVF